MGWDSNGTFVYTATTVAPTASGGTTISSADFNTFSAELAEGLSLCLTEDGQNVPTANLPMNAKKHTGVAVGVDTDDYMTYGQAGQLRTKVIEIGTWDMVASGTVTPLHGLTLAKIRNVSALIRNDTDTQYYDLAAELTTPAATSTFKGIRVNATVVNLVRHYDGAFNSIDFETMGDDGNRGWITIQYTD